MVTRRPGNGEADWALVGFASAIRLAAIPQRASLHDFIDQPAGGAGCLQWHCAVSLFEPDMRRDQQVSMYG